MPGRAKKFKRMIKKRAYKKRSGQKMVNVNRALRPFAQRYITKMKYSEAVSLAGNGPQAYRWSLNNIWDPNYQGIGHQPYGFDQLAALYNRYRVISCSYVISVAPTDGNYLRIATLPANEQVNALSLSEMCENPRAKFITQAPQAALKTLKGKVSLPSLVGRNKSQYMADDRYQSVVTGGPAELAILNVFAQRLDDGINAINAGLSITLEYTVEFFDVKTLGQS